MLCLPIEDSIVGLVDEGEDQFGHQVVLMAQVGINVRRARQLLKQHHLYC